LHVCLPTYLALLSSTLGCLSITSWLFAQIPQIFKNYSLQSTSGLSVYFLVEWCLGDTTNLLGCLLTEQAEWQVVVAAYYVCVDVVLVWQYFWYTHVKPSLYESHGKGHYTHDPANGGHGEMVRTPGEVNGSGDSKYVPQQALRRVPDREDNNNSRVESSLTLHASSPPSKEHSGNTLAIPINNRASFRGDRSGPLMPSPRTLLMMSLIIAVVSAQPSAPPPHSSPPGSTPATSSSETLGSFISWSSTLLYHGSRLPQIYKNHMRQSTSGLSAKLFIAAFFGNLFYATSILSNPCAWNDFPAHGGHGWAGAEGSDRSEWIARAAPFWLGAAGVLGLDATVGAQFLMFGDKRRGGDLPVVIAADERGRRRWRFVTGWMRGWVPRVARLGLDKAAPGEGELLLNGHTDGHRRGSYGSV
jgi:uncharacterized protein with PQ loop repeat